MFGGTKENLLNASVGIVGFLSEIGKEYLQNNHEREQTFEAMNIVGICFVLGGSKCYALGCVFHFIYVFL
jgi:hypothetical protein